MLGDLDNTLVGFSWKFTASGTKRQLAPPWAASTVIAQYDAVSVAANGVGVILVASVGGTTGTTAPTGAGTDGGVTWVAYSLAGAKRIDVVNTDTVSPANVGDANLQILPVPTNNGSVGPLPATPLALYASAPSGSPVLVVAVAA